VLPARQPRAVLPAPRTRTLNPSANPNPNPNPNVTLSLTLTLILALTLALAHPGALGTYARRRGVEPTICDATDECNKRR